MGDLNLFFLDKGVNPMEPTPTVKPGWKTTELWFNLAAALFGVLLAVGVFTPEQGCAGDWCAVAQTITGGLVAVLAAIGYQWSRSQLKASTAHAAVRAESGN